MKPRTAALAVCGLAAATAVTARELNRRPWLLPAERQARQVLGVPARHPERITGSDRAACSRFFRVLTAELAAGGIDAGQILDEFRRGL